MRLMVVFAYLLIPLLADAQPNYVGPMRFETFWPCAGNGGMCGIKIFAQGMIQADSGKKFTQFLNNPKLHRHQLPSRPSVVFDSPGGSVAGAIDLGKVIRNRKFDTEAAPSFSRVVEGKFSEEEEFSKSPICASACVIAFSGGLSRAIEKGSRIGIHQFAAGSGNIGDSATQITVVILAKYLSEMGVSRDLLDKASLVSPTSMYWLTDAEASQFQLDNSHPPLSPWVLTATPQGSPILDVVQQISHGRRVGVRIASTSYGILLAATIYLDRRAYKTERLKQFPLDQDPQISICAAKRCTSGVPVRPWAKGESDTSVTFQAIVVFSDVDFQKFSNATELLITDGFGTATSDVSLSTILSTDGFSSGVALLNRAK